MSFSQEYEESPKAMPPRHRLRHFNSVRQRSINDAYRHQDRHQDRQDRRERRSDHERRPDHERQNATPQQQNTDRRRSRLDDDNDEDQPRRKHRREQSHGQQRRPQQKKDDDEVTVVKVDKSDLMTCNRAGRWAVRSVDLVLGLKIIIQKGLKYRGKEPNTTQKAALKKYSGNKPALEELLDKFEEGATSARSDDTHKIKDDILALIQFDDRHRLTLPLPREKSDLGFKYRETAFLCCPVDDVDKFNESPREYMTAVTDGFHKISWLELPVFLFDIEMECEQPLAAIFRGYFLLRVFIHIFCTTGIPGRLATYGNKPKKPIGARNGLSMVQPQHVAYSVVQACYAISDQKSWDMSVSSAKLYFWVLDFFEAPAFKSQGDEILAAWTELYNENLSHNKAPAALDDGDDIPAEGSTMARLMAMKNAGEATHDGDIGPPPGAGVTGRGA